MIMEKVKKVIIVDDFALSRAILKKMIASRSDLVVCGEFENAEDCIDYLKNHSADLVIMDFCLPKINGTNASNIIKSFAPDIKIILLVSANTRSEILMSLFANVDAYALKDVSQTQLSNIMDTVFSNNIWIDFRIQYAIFNFIKYLPSSDYVYFKTLLTSNEGVLIDMILKGVDKCDIAKFLNIQLSDLALAVRSIFKKLSKTKRVIQLVEDFKYDFA